MTNSADAPAAIYPISVTVPEGYTHHVSAETASRSYVVNVTPGTYPIEYMTSNFGPVDPEAAPHTRLSAYWAMVRVPTVAPARSESSAEFAGVVYGMRDIPETAEDHRIQMYAYEVRGKAARGALVFNYA